MTKSGMLFQILGMVGKGSLSEVDVAAWHR